MNEKTDLGRYELGLGEWILLVISCWTVLHFIGVVKGKATAVYWLLLWLTHWWWCDACWPQTEASSMPLNSFYLVRTLFGAWASHCDCEGIRQLSVGALSPVNHAYLSRPLVKQMPWSWTQSHFRPVLMCLCQLIHDWRPTWWMPLGTCVLNMKIAGYLYPNLEWWVATEEHSAPSLFYFCSYKCNWIRW